MPYTVIIKHIASGEERTHIEGYEWDSDFLWSEGNFSCDCNRGLLFARAAGEENPNHPCSTGLHPKIYSVSITLPDGRCVYAEEVRENGDIEPVEPTHQ